jgi:uncharacterized protein (DUF305 family)
MFSRFAAGLLLALTVASAVACRSTEAGSGAQIVQPGAPGEASRVITAGRATDLSDVQHTPADARFMQGMIGHHAQALEMTALVPSRTMREEIRLLAGRIEASQADEIRMMQAWLRDRNEKLPDPHAHHAPGAPLMPGMLTAEQMQRLAAAKGAEFDRLFLEYMIAHHEGALVMVDQLFSTPSAGQESDVFAFASDVDADQRMEIDRMLAVLAMITSKEPRK